jgi:hypothetical protein
MMIQMDMLGRNNNILKIEPFVRIFVQNLFVMIVIDERHGACNSLPFVQLFLYQLLPYQIPQCFRAIGIFSFLMSVANLLSKAFSNDTPNLTNSDIDYDRAIFLFFVTQFDVFVKRRF